MGMTIELAPADDGGWLVTAPNGGAAPTRYDERAQAESDAMEFLRLRGGGRLLIRNDSGDVAMTLRADGAPV